MNKIPSEISLIVAIGKDGAIGKKGNLIWKISDDLRRFKRLTTGHPVIMGRKTWESLPVKPLPKRLNIVVTRQPDYDANGAVTVPSIQKALDKTIGMEPFVIGGAEVYKEFLPYINKLYLTVVDDKCEDADTFLDLDLDNSWQLTEESEKFVTEDGIKYSYRTYCRF